MRPASICTFIISLLFGVSVWAQEEVAVDTVKVKDQKYGIRVGTDLIKLGRTLLEDGYTGFEVQGDIRITNKWYAALELGNDDREWDKDGLRSNTSGSYFKLGADYNAYENWEGMNNAIFVGLRYGFATFSQELIEYSVYTTNTTFPTQPVQSGETYDGLTASWAELIIGVKTEVWNNLYLGLNVQLRHMVSEDKPDNFDNLIIPGFNRTYDSSDWGVGYGYTISYLIPIIKK